MTSVSDARYSSQRIVCQYFDLYSLEKFSSSSEAIMVLQKISNATLH
jgi:hypothetical protein